MTLPSYTFYIQYSSIHNQLNNLLKTTAILIFAGTPMCIILTSFWAQFIACSTSDTTSWQFDLLLYEICGSHNCFWGCKSSGIWHCIFWVSICWHFKRLLYLHLQGQTGLLDPDNECIMILSKIWNHIPNNKALYPAIIESSTIQIVSPSRSNRILSLWKLKHMYYRR